YCSNPNWVTVHSDDSSYVYAYHDNEWFNYDDEDTIAAKGQFAQEKGLAGFMMYSMESDDFNGICGIEYPILIGINDAFDEK
ncbi:putative chitinase 10, partial [Blattella germanica]